MQVAHPEALVVAVPRAAARNLLPVEHRDVCDAEAAELDRTGESRRPAADHDDAHRPPSSSARTRAPQ